MPDHVFNWRIDTFEIYQVLCLSKRVSCIKWTQGEENELLSICHGTTHIIFWNDKHIMDSKFAKDFPIKKMVWSSNYESLLLCSNHRVIYAEISSDWYSANIIILPPAIWSHSRFRAQSCAIFWSSWHLRPTSKFPSHSSWAYRTFHEPTRSVWAPRLQLWHCRLRSAHISSKSHLQPLQAGSKSGHSLRPRKCHWWLWFI